MTEVGGGSCFEKPRHGDNGHEQFRFHDRSRKAPRPGAPFEKIAD
jgi:hypothetical protein